MKPKIILLEDNHQIAKSYQQILKNYYFDVRITHNSDDFFLEYKKNAPDLILLDIKLNKSELSGLEVFEQLHKKEKFYSEVIVLSGNATRLEIAKAMQLGAYNFIEKSEFNKDKFVADINAAIKLKKSEDDKRLLQKSNKNMLQSKLLSIPLIGESIAMREVKTKIKRFAQSKVNVLIQGETGTGKEIVAKHIHLNSDKYAKELEVVNCAGLPDSIVDTLLFGNIKGIYTGAISDTIGKFEKAHHGYLFLDEIADMSLLVQSKILRTIENKEVDILGGKTKKIDVRFIFASNQELLELVNNKLFREDLFYRIHKNVIKLPPLRDRGKDVLLLTSYFLQQLSKNHQSIIDIQLEKIYNYFKSNHWRGNVRELYNFCEHLVVNFNFIDNTVIANELEKKKSGLLQKSDECLINLLKIEHFNDATSEFERMYIQYHLKKNNNQVSKTAKEIGVDRGTIYNKMKKIRV